MITQEKELYAVRLERKFRAGKACWIITIHGVSCCRDCLKPISNKPINCSSATHQQYYKHRKDATCLSARNHDGIYSRRAYWAAKRKVMILLGGKCAGCGSKDIRLLKVNHKNGCGMANRKHSIVFYYEILNGKRTSDDLDARCPNCNTLYEYEVGRRRGPPDGDVSL